MRASKSRVRQRRSAQKLVLKTEVVYGDLCAHVLGGPAANQPPSRPPRCASAVGVQTGCVFIRVKLMQARRQTFGQIDGGCHVTSGDYRCFAQRHGRVRRQAENVSHEVDAVAVASGEALRCGTT